MSTTSRALDELVPQALRAFPVFESSSLPSWRPLSGGLINATFAVGDAHILQRVSPIFAPEIHHNIEAVSEQLTRRGISSPRLLHDSNGRPWATLPDGSVWRLMTRIRGESFSIADPPKARTAAALVGRWHAATDDLAHEFVAQRVGVHDTDAHLRSLREALADHADHRLFAEVSELAEHILGAAQSLPRLPAPVVRPCHGDLKMNNVVFDEGTAVALIDLDTVGPMCLAHELGDAWRSWCNPVGEDGTDVRFDLETLAASFEGYQEGYAQPIDASTRAGLVLGVEWISLELSARFATDALRECYFGWNPDAHQSRGGHNLARAHGQWRMHLATTACRAERHAILHR